MIMVLSKRKEVIQCRVRNQERQMDPFVLVDLESSLSLFPNTDIRQAF